MRTGSIAGASVAAAIGRILADIWGGCVACWGDLRVCTQYVGDRADCSGSVISAIHDGDVAVVTGK